MLCLMKPFQEYFLILRSKDHLVEKVVGLEVVGVMIDPGDRIGLIGVVTEEDENNSILKNQ